MGSVEQAGSQWKTFGRDTEAGRALFKLYGNKPKVSYPKPKTKPIDSTRRKWNDGTASQQNARPYDELNPAPRGVAVPKVNGGRQRRQFFPIEFAPSKKREDLINLELQSEDFDQFNAPPPSKHISAADKDALCNKHQFSDHGVLPKTNFSARDNVRMEKAQELAMSKHSMRAVPGQETNEQLFTSIVGEINERKAFLDDMTAHGKGKQYKAQMEAEIAERVGNLKLLNNVITKATVPSSGTVGINNQENRPPPIHIP